MALSLAGELAILLGILIISFVTAYVAFHELPNEDTERSSQQPDDNKQETSALQG